MGLQRMKNYVFFLDTGFVTHWVVEDRDLNEESNDNLKAENHRHLSVNIRLALNTLVIQGTAFVTTREWLIMIKYLSWCDVGEGSCEENPANDSNKGGGQTKHPVHWCPILEKMVLISTFVFCKTRNYL